ncbi:MAG TPA: class I SAM-dependent methyltransferase, partial [Bacteroidia bacterium]|nr:class I SAM-dependent methyltransferase [Bacteroidia bacterium]
MAESNQVVPGQGVRKLTLKDQAPDCEIFIHQDVYQLRELVKNKKVVDIGCGYGRNRALVESLGGEWTGVEPFEGGAHTVVANAEDLPFADNTFDVAIMDAVLEHIPHVSQAFSEVAR